MSFTDRIRNNPIRIDRLFRGGSEGVASISPRVYQRSPGERYTFENGQIRLNGIPLSNLIAGEAGEDRPDISLLAGLASAIDEYRKEVWKKEGKHYAAFNGAAQGLLDLIGGRMLHVYEEVTGGVRLQMANGRLWINRIDPRAVLTLFLANPTEERQKYLKGFLYKLDLILAGKIGNPRSRGIFSAAQQLREDILQALDLHAAPVRRPLLAAATSA